jgi:lipoprotein-anchoring transpeptidase ErfK/SrfK
MSALKDGEGGAGLDVTTLEPEVTADAYDQVLLTRIGENKLYLYQDGKITHSWVVATGLPEYPTPTGLYSLIEKRYMPTWVNPAPDTWGASMPESIPPGPNNPLGLRALNWSAPAIRFHGTSATYSLGFNASHGCVRMSNEDVIQLYDMIEVGTPIVSVQAGPNRPLYTSPSIDPNPVPTAENDDA